MTARPQDLDALLTGLVDATVDDDAVEIRVDDGADEDEAIFVAYVGLVDLVAEASLDALDADARGAAIARGRQVVGAAEGPLRFALHERATTAENQELVARMRAKDIALTSGWLLPRLSHDIDAYRRRIEALGRLIEERRR